MGSCCKSRNRPRSESKIIVVLIKREWETVLSFYVIVGYEIKVITDNRSLSIQWNIRILDTDKFQAATDFTATRCIMLKIFLISFYSIENVTIM